MEDQYCYCENCRTEGSYQERHGTVPKDCLFYDWINCQGCGYYGPSESGKEHGLCSGCYQRFLDSLCQHDDHIGKEVDGVTLVEAISNDTGPRPIRIRSVRCQKHTPTLAETLEHNLRQGLTLAYFRVSRYYGGRVIEEWSRESRAAS
jgi:hypothetical protein